MLTGAELRSASPTAREGTRLPCAAPPLALAGGSPQRASSDGCPGSASAVQAERSVPHFLALPMLGCQDAALARKLPTKGGAARAAARLHTVTDCRGHQQPGRDPGPRVNASGFTTAIEVKRDAGSASLTPPPPEPASCLPACEAHCHPDAASTHGVCPQARFCRFRGQRQGPRRGPCFRFGPCRAPLPRPGRRARCRGRCDEGHGPRNGRAA
jgi:hypothetical protein